MPTLAPTAPTVKRLSVQGNISLETKMATMALFPNLEYLALEFLYNLWVYRSIDSWGSLCLVKVKRPQHPLYQAHSGRR